MLGWVSLRFLNSETFTSGWECITNMQQHFFKKCVSTIMFGLLHYSLLVEMDHSPSINREECDAVTCPQGIASSSFLIPCSVLWLTLIKLCWLQLLLREKRFEQIHKLKWINKIIKQTSIKY